MTVVEEASYHAMQAVHKTLTGEAAPLGETFRKKTEAQVVLSEEMLAKKAAFEADENYVLSRSYRVSTNIPKGY